MQERVAIVTGGMGGIGTAICKSLADQGVTVVAGYKRDHDKAEAWRQSMANAGYQFHINYVDVTDYDSSQSFVAQTLERFGRIDILVNNAGITRDATLKKMKPIHWSEVISTNLNSVYNLTQNVINHMIDRGYGRIINIASINGQKGQFGQTNYSAAKAGIHGFTKALAQEVAAKGVTVNTVSPGYVATEMVKAMDQRVLDSIVSQVPIKRLAEPEEVARCVSFLADDKSEYITGTNLMINGGQYLL